MGLLKCALVGVLCAVALGTAAAQGPYTVGSGNQAPITVPCCATVTYSWQSGPHGISVLDNGACSNSGSVDALGPIQQSGSVPVPFTQAGDFWVTDPLNCRTGLNQKVTVQACSSDCSGVGQGVNNNVNTGNGNNNNGGNNNNPGGIYGNNNNNPGGAGGNNNNNGGNNNNPGGIYGNNNNNPGGAGGNNNNNGGNNNNPGGAGGNNNNNPGGPGGNNNNNPGGAGGNNNNNPGGGFNNNQNNPGGAIVPAATTPPAAPAAAGDASSTGPIAWGKVGTAYPAKTITCGQALTYTWSGSTHGITVLSNGQCLHSGNVNAIYPASPSGTATVPFTQPGTYYVTDPSGNNCQAGVNQQVTVTGNC